MVEVTLAVGTFSVDSGCSAAGGSRIGGRVYGWKGIGLKTIPCKCQMPNPKFRQANSPRREKKNRSKIFYRGQTDEGIAVCILGAVVGQCLRHNCEVRKAGRDEHRSLIPTDSEVVKGVGID